MHTNNNEGDDGSISQVQSNNVFGGDPAGGGSQHDTMQFKSMGNTQLASSTYRQMDSNRSAFENFKIIN